MRRTNCLGMLSFCIYTAQPLVGTVYSRDGLAVLSFNLQHIYKFFMGSRSVSDFYPWRHGLCTSMPCPPLVDCSIDWASIESTVSW